MKYILILVSLFFPLCVFSGDSAKKIEEPQKPMKLFVEIDSKLYEVIIDKKGVPKPKEIASADIQKKFKSEAVQFGIAYIKGRIILEKKSQDKTGQ